MAVHLRQTALDGGRRLRRALTPSAAKVMAEAIRDARAAASGDARPIPPHIREVLEPYFAASTLDRARWTLADPERDSLGDVLAGRLFREGGVTFDHVIVFSTPNQAQSMSMWVHELAHVEQYGRLGVAGFARRYTEDWRALEVEAKHRDRQIRGDLAAKGKLKLITVVLPDGREVPREVPVAARA